MMLGPKKVTICAGNIPKLCFHLRRIYPFSRDPVGLLTSPISLVGNNILLHLNPTSRVNLGSGKARSLSYTSHPAWWRCDDGLPS